MAAEIPFRDVLWAMAHAADANPDPAAGVVTLSTLDKTRYTAHLQTAIRQLWAPVVHGNFVWPETVVGEEIAVTSGKIACTLLGAGDFWTLWKSDPRVGFDPDSPSSVETLRLESTHDGSFVYPGTSAATVYAFYRRAVPQFTATRVNTARTYNPSSGSEETPATPAQATLAVQAAEVVITIQVNGGVAVVYTLAFTDPANGSQWIDLNTYATDYQVAERLRDRVNSMQGSDVVASFSTGFVYLTTIDSGAAATMVITRSDSPPGYPISVTGTDGMPAYDEGVVKAHLVFDELNSGHVYKAIGLDALGSDLTDETKWEVQAIPDRLQEALHVQAEVLRLRAKGLYQESRQLQAMADDVLEREMSRIYYAENRVPWFTMYPPR